MLKKSEPINTIVFSPGEPTQPDWLIAIFLVIVQQNAFAATAFELVNPGEAFNGTDNVFNTASVSISIFLLAVACARVWPLLRSLACRNLYSVPYILMVLCSAVWSLHPDLSIRRGCAYVLTIGVAAYITVRFKERALLVLARSFAFCAVCSLLFVLLFPEIGIMSGGELEGNWRGIYPHKNVLGFVMAVAVFTQMYIITTTPKNKVSAYLWAGFYLFLIVVSDCKTALILSIIYTFVALNYTIWKKNRLVGYNTFLSTLIFLSLLSLGFFLDPEVFLDLIGKDATLTGRTEVWGPVMELIGHSPLLGWGYRAMWVPTDPATIWVDAKAGDWGVPSAHNAILEVALELGFLGLGSLALVIFVAFWRGIRCCKLGVLPLGLFSLVFFAATIIAGQTIETLGINQEIDWLVFNILSFLAGESLVAASSQQMLPLQGGYLRSRFSTPRDIQLM